MLYDKAKKKNNNNKCQTKQMSVHMKYEGESIGRICLSNRPSQHDGLNLPFAMKMGLHISTSYKDILQQYNCHNVS